MEIDELGNPNCDVVREFVETNRRRMGLPQKTVAELRALKGVFRRVGKDGIQLAPPVRYYVHEDLGALRGKEVEVRYSDDDQSRIWVILPDTRILEALRHPADKSNDNTIQVGPDDEECRIEFPGGNVQIIRTTDGNFWAHIQVNRRGIEGGQPARIAKARVDVVGDPIDEMDIGDLAHPHAYHFAVLVERSDSFVNDLVDPEEDYYEKNSISSVGGVGIMKL